MNAQTIALILLFAAAGLALAALCERGEGPSSCEPALIVACLAACIGVIGVVCWLADLGVAG